MKEKTIEALKKNLNRDKNLEEGFEKNEDFVYEIEFLPVLTKRNKQGRLEGITGWSNRLLFESENS